MAQEILMTAEGYEELKNELQQLKTVKRAEVADKIKTARGFGDLSENSEYDEAKNEQGKLYSRIAEVENILLHAVIVEEDVGQTDIVTIGSKVTISAIDSGKTLVFKVVGSQEADFPNGAISEDSPVGKALMGARVGDIVTVEAPRGSMDYKIEKIER